MFNLNTMDRKEAPVSNAASPTRALSSAGTARHAEPCPGMLIINADDWGRDHQTTEPIRQCIARGTVSSVSAMVFMEDSERAAALARERGIDAGLHLNLSAPFTGSNCPTKLLERQGQVAKFLLRHPMARIVFHPGLASSFEYAVAAQIEEFTRLYGFAPQRIDGHHHLHLCANVVFGRLLPAGTIARRNFTFPSGEKSFINRWYRRAMDRSLARNHSFVDFLFNLAPLEPADRLRRIVALARKHLVEVETHPINQEEFGFLMGGQIFDLVRDVPIASRFAAPGTDTVPAATRRLTQGEA